MAPITDLTWSQLNIALRNRLNLPSNAPNIIGVDAYGLPATIDIDVIVGAFPLLGEDEAGVVKFMAILLDACRDAQTTVNVNQPVGERLTAFPDATSAAPVGTLVPVTRTMISRADLSSVTKVLGRVA